MNISDIKLSLVRYKMKSFKIMVPGLDPFELDEQYIMSISMEKNYDSYYFPFFQVEVGIPNYLYRAMKKDNLNIKAYVNFQGGKFSEIVPNESGINFNDYINGTFMVFLEDMSPEPLESMIEAHEKEQGTFNKGYGYGELTVVKLLLYREDYLFKSKKIINAVLSSPTLPDALTYVLNQAGLSNVLISPPDSYKVYNEFVITPISAMEQIERICNEYGLHINGTTIFFDFSYMYLLNKTSHSNAYMPNETSAIYMGSLMRSAPDSIMGKGCYAKSGEYCFLNIDPDSITIKEKSGLNDQVFGNDFISIDTATGSIKTINSGVTNAASRPAMISRTVISNKGAETSSAIKKSLQEASKIAILGFSYVDLWMFAPNKEFILSLEDIKFTKYNGKFRLSKMVAIFENEGIYWAPHVTAEFKG